MPKAPILSRECFYDRLRDGSFRDLDWNLVNTSLGAMLEPRQLSIGHRNGRLPNVDAKDASFNRRTEFDEDRFFTTFNHAGYQLPVDFNV